MMQHNVYQITEWQYSVWCTGLYKFRYAFTQNTWTPSFGLDEVVSWHDDAPIKLRIPMTITYTNDNDDDAPIKLGIPKSRWQRNYMASWRFLKGHLVK